MEETSLCNSCETEELKLRIQQIANDPDDAVLNQIASLGAVTRPRNGIDYTVNLEGHWVFSKWYLLRRGYCCDSGCTNCPYKT